MRLLFTKLFDVNVQMLRVYLQIYDQILYKGLLMT